MAADRMRIDDPDDEVLPASPERRRAAAIVGCLTLLLMLAGLVWFIATHTDTFESQGLFGF